MHIYIDLSDVAVMDFLVLVSRCGFLFVYLFAGFAVDLGVRRKDAGTERNEGAHYPSG